jgi:hypothetical protein
MNNASSIHSADIVDFSFYLFNIVSSYDDNEIGIPARAHVTLMLKNNTPRISNYVIRRHNIRTAARRIIWTNKSSKGPLL